MSPLIHSRRSRARCLPSGGIEPTDVDVLCSRTKSAFQHEGNRVFRVLIASHVDTYRHAGRKEKSQLVASIVAQIIANQGRFLRYVNGAWTDAGVRTGRAKVGHAFRDASHDKTQCINEIRAQLKKGGGSSASHQILVDAVSFFAPSNSDVRDHQAYAIHASEPILDSIDLDADSDIWDAVDDSALPMEEDLLFVALSPPLQTPSTTTEQLPVLPPLPSQADRIESIEVTSLLQADVLEVLDNMPLATFTEIEQDENRLFTSYVW